MSNANSPAHLGKLALYQNNFLREVEERVEEGHSGKMCMQDVV